MNSVKKSNYKTTQRYARILGEDVDEALNIIDAEETDTMPQVLQFKKLMIKTILVIEVAALLIALYIMNQ